MMRKTSFLTALMLLLIGCSTDGSEPPPAVSPEATTQQIAAEPSATALPKPSATPTALPPTATASLPPATATATATPTAQPSPTATATATLVPTPTSTSTPAPNTAQLLSLGEAFLAAFDELDTYIGEMWLSWYDGGTLSYDLVSQEDITTAEAKVVDLTALGNSILAVPASSSTSDYQTLYGTLMDTVSSCLLSANLALDVTDQMALPPEERELAVAAEIIDRHRAQTEVCVGNIQALRSLLDSLQ